MTSLPSEILTPQSGDPAGDFEQGLLAGAESHSLPTGDSARITATSRWLNRRCGRCNHTFRRGDPVRVDPGSGDVRHLDPATHCGSDADDVAASPAAEAFIAGLLQAWPAAGEVPVFRLAEGDLQVATPGAGPLAMTCLVCGHTFRPGDYVVVCPCAQDVDDPRRAFCSVSVHRDPARGLNCWDDWLPAGRPRRCPRTVEKLPE
jgi:hypothetical protein